MTYDELLAKILNVAYAHDNGHTIDKDRIVKQLNSLRAIAELHKPWISNTGIWCSGCEDWQDKSTAYPCPTIQAIEKELG